MSWASDAVTAIAKRGRIDEGDLVDALVTLGFEEGTAANAHPIVGDDLVDLIDTAAWLSILRQAFDSVAKTVEYVKHYRQRRGDPTWEDWAPTVWMDNPNDLDEQRRFGSEHRLLVMDAWRAIGQKPPRQPGRDAEVEDALIGQLEAAEARITRLEKALGWDVDPAMVAYKALAAIGFVIGCGYALWHTARYAPCHCLRDEVSCDGCRCQAVINGVDP